MLLQPLKSENSDFSLNLISIEHNFGFDSQRYYNLQVLPGPVLVYITARFLHFYDVLTKTLTIRRSTTIEGVDQITTHPTLDHLAVGEKGHNASVLIYEWPSMGVVSQLDGGQSIGYDSIRYNTDGSLLATASSAPDHLLTIWKWESAEILLQAKAHEHDVYGVTFSNSNPIQLASCGVGHLKVWQMTETFTGLKLEEELGRFGITETCDLIDVLPLADGSCATGSPWGNIMVWSEGSIKMQILRNGRLPCHSGAITHLQHFYQSLLTAGMDGAVRIWNYETLENADPTEEDPFIETEPLFELFIGEDDISAKILSLVKATNNDEDLLWFGQDAKGTVWRLEISMTQPVKPAERVFWGHAGPVVCMQTSLNQPLLLTLGSDSKLIVNNYKKKTMETYIDFNSHGTCLKWLPISLCPAGNLLICGFADGTLRLLMIHDLTVSLVQALKPHSKEIVGFAVSPRIIITASRDSTIFIFQCATKEESLELIPYGYCPTVNPACCITWKNGTSILVGCQNGEIMTIAIPTNLAKAENKDTYLIDLNSEVFESGILIQNQEESVKNKEINFLWPVKNGNVSFSFNNKLIEYDFNEKQIVKILDDVIPPNSLICCIFHWKHGNCLFFGLSDGKLHAVKMDDNESLTPHWWSCGVHDSLRGSVRCIVASWDEKNLFSCGDDSAIFSYKLEDFPASPVLLNLPQPSKFELVTDVEDTFILTLEESKRKANQDKAKDIENKRKQTVFETLNQLKDEYVEIINSNKDLPAEVKFSKEELIVDERIVLDFNKSLNDMKQLIIRKVLRDVEKSERQLEKLTKYFLDDVETLTTRIYAINCDSFVETFRLRKLDEEYYRSLAHIQQLSESKQEQGSTQSAPKVLEVIPETPAEMPDAVESLVKQVAAVGDTGKSPKLMAVCRQRKARRVAMAKRKAVWDQLMSRAPNPDETDPRDLRAIENAKANMGDYQLKSSENFKMPEGQNVTTISVNKTLLAVFQQTYNLKSEFNQKVLKLRNRKQTLIEKHKMYRNKLKDISKSIPETSVMTPPNLPTFIEHFEFPENNFLIQPEHTKVEEAEEEIGEPNHITASNFKTEIEMYKLSKELKLQSNIIHDIEKDIASFDHDLKELMEEKIGLEVDIKFLDLFKLKLNREILLLKVFEHDENDNSSTAFNLLKEKQKNQLKINAASRRINEKTNEINELKEQVKKMSLDFMEIIAENKYYEYLKMIYKKKFKPPKVKFDEDEDSLSSDSGSDSDIDEDNSIDSKELVSAKLRESVCPEACDPEIYKLTFHERKLRHDIELRIDEKQIELSKLIKTCEALTKERNKIHIQYLIAQKDVDTLQSEKQSQLNEIETVVVLKLSQFHNLKDETQLVDMNDSLVMNTSVLADLYGRTADIKREIHQENNRYEENRMHLKRMDIDIHYMEDMALELHKGIEETMLIKFGVKIDLDEMEEAIVKKLISEMNYIPFQLDKQLNSKMKAMEETVNEKIEKYAGILVENTKRCNLFTLLKNQKNNLEEILLKQESKQPTKNLKLYDTDKLKEIVANQTQQIQALKAEIGSYKKKSRPTLKPFIFPTMQTTIVTPDGKKHPIPAQLRDQLIIIAADLQELFIFINEDRAEESVWARIKKLVEKFMDAIPEAALQAMWSELSMGSDAELEILLDDEQVLMRAARMTCEMIQPIVTSTH